MNGAPLEQVRWPRRRWQYTIGLVFLAQLSLIFLAADRSNPRRRLPVFRTAISFAVEPSSENPSAESSELDDPTVFALPSLRGFSGRAWLSFARPDYEFVAWTPPPHWLAPEMEWWGQPFLAFARTNSTAPLRLADKPPLSVRTPNPSVTNTPLAMQSEYRVEGDLAVRPLLNSPALPSWPHSDILTNTVMQLLVDGEGRTFPTLLSSCGKAEADQFALKAAAAARFEVNATNGERVRAAQQVAWGRMIIRWHTVPLSFTNIPAKP